MRALALALLASTACLSSPGGVARSWPPPLGTTDVAAVATGDLDGDGTSDVIVLVAGTAATGAGVYLLRGGADVQASAATPLTTFTGYTPLASVGAPAAGLLVTVGGEPAVLFAYERDGQVELTLLETGALDIKADGSTGISIDTQHEVWLQPITFPGGAQRLLLGAGDQVRHLDPSTLVGSTISLNLLPGPGAGFSSPQTGTSYTSGSSTIAVIASAASIDRSAIPTMPPPQGMFSWSTVRSGATWSGQTVFTLTGDHGEVLGYDGSLGLCAIDPAGAAQPSCVTASIASGGGVHVVAGDLGGMTAPDVALVAGGDGNAMIQLFPDVTFTSGTLGGPTPLPTTTTSISGAHAVAYDHGVLLVGANGAATCVAIGPSGAGSCP
jgi:hypothetical protein